MTCKNKDCKNKQCRSKEDQSTKAFREYLEANPGAPEAVVYDV